MQWNRNTASRLESLGASIEEGCEVSLHTNQMETSPEEQQSQQGVHREPNAYRSMRDHIHPPRVSAPSCIIPPEEDVAVRPYLVPLPRLFIGGTLLSTPQLNLQHSFYSPSKGHIK